MRPIFDRARASVVPESLPLIASNGIRAIRLNFEATGLRWFDRDVPISMALDYPTDTGFATQYLSWAHASENNTTLDAVRDWANVELRGVTISNINTRFDVHMGRVAGIDFEALGCPLRDVGHMAALLDDHRQRSSLDVLAVDYLGPIQVPRLDESQMRHYNAGLAAPRAKYNVQLVRELEARMLPRVEAESLLRVLALEERLIYVVCEMEKNGTRLNLEKLDRWIARSAREMAEIQAEIAQLTHRPVVQDLFGTQATTLNPDSSKEMEALFKELGLPITRTATGRPSFTAAVLASIDHPVIARIRRLNRLIDLRAKYLTHHRERLDDQGILRYALHQLRATKSEASGAGEAGTVSGRFSSTEIVSGVGTNIQQEVKLAKQRVAWGFDEDDHTHDDEIYPIRELHEPLVDGYEWLASDARQIEYRLFAHEVNSERINAAFQVDPLISFHRFMHAELKKRKPDLTYRRMKDVNFAKIYAAGPKKMAFMLGFITLAQFEMLTETKAKNSHPLLKEVNEILKIYDQEIPEAKSLIERSSRIAKERGYICSILGRRSRFPNGWRLHKALNTRIQPSAADIMKTKLVELHDARKDTGFIMQFTVHDEVDGSIPDRESAKKVANILDSQTFNLRVPVLWETGVGPNWAKADADIESDVVRELRGATK